MSPRTSVYRFAQRNRWHGRPGKVLNNFNRYWHLFVPYMTPRKFTNLLLAHAEMIAGRACPSSKPYMLRIEPINRCNLRCPGCSTGLGINPRPAGLLDVNNLQRVLKQIAPYLCLTRLDGLGEPLLHPHICELIRTVHEAGSAVALSSHLGPNTLKPGQARELVESGLDHLIVSIDGPDAETYAKYRVGGDFHLTCEHVREVVAAKRACGSVTPLIDIQFLGFDHNRHLADRMPPLVRNLGADRLTCKMVDPDVLKERKAVDFRRHRCFWLYTTWSIACDGDRKLCPNTFTDTFGLPNAFAPGNDLTKDQPLLQAARRFLAGDRDFSHTDPLLGDSKTRHQPWRLPRGPEACRCFGCASTGMVIDRSREWIRDYVCM
ncbi:MAG: radical SAM protein [Phycisphaerae bacterium]|nr:radical SAM protein [Phycisphaerae bacterium]